MQSKVYTINSFIYFTGLTDLRKISNQHVYEWMRNQSQRGNTGRTINDRLAHLLAMLHWQQDMNLSMSQLRLGLITKTKEESPRKVYFTRQQIDTVLTYANMQEWLFIRLAFDCGLRISELQKLRLSNIHDNRILINGKGSKNRYAFLSSETQTRLQQWILEQNITNYVWPSPTREHQPLATCTIRQNMQKVFAKAGFNDFCPHDLRHSYATDLKQLGIPTRKIQAGLGHASEATTERYLSDLDGLDLYEIYQIKYNRQH